MKAEMQDSSMSVGRQAVGSQSQSRSNRLGAVVGFALIACGLVLNEWTIANIASPDGKIELTPVRAGIWAVDAFLIVIGMLVVKYPDYGKYVLKVGVSLTSLAICSLLIFSFLEIFPTLIVHTKLDYAHYYAQKSRFIADDELVFRNRPNSVFQGRSFRGNQYRAKYGVNMAPIPYTAVYDADGFRNGSQPRDVWHVAVLGDSNVEYGHDEDDTFSSRLGVLSGLTTRNLGTGSYSPIHYVTVFKRYGLTPELKYVLFCFSEHNDIADIRDYKRWKANRDGYGNYNLTDRTFVQRYVMALKDVLYTPLASVVAGGHEDSAGDLVTIRLRNSEVKAVITYKNDTRMPGELLEMDEWKTLKALLREFKGIATDNNIVPLVLFFPTKAHIYAEYTTPESEPNWLRVREQQIASKNNVEGALRLLCREVGIELISVSPAFEQAANEGKMLFYPFDSHWNSEGRQLAAAVVAETLSASRREPIRSR
jgi:hypothetical protein